MTEDRKFRSISLSNDLVTQVEERIKANTEYSSIADFVTEATRLRLQKLGRSRDFELEGDLRDLESRVQKLTDPERRAKAEALFVGLCELFGVKKEAA